ncbi:MAG TPA: TIGR03086 family metal-binding protein [Streptosporangiaceae bacterium]|nr:TIGR03086 family metal-binding protein [Streptosporangiaceae bacterium]
MNKHAEMAAAAAETIKVVAGVRPDQFGDPTPCPEWDVRTLLNHIILWTAYSAEQRAYGGSVAEELMNKDFTASPDFATDYAKQAKKAVDAWSDPAAWERDLGVMGSPMPAADVAALLIAEYVLHGWDLATATGQRYECDEAVATLVVDVVREQGDLFRQYKGFAEQVTVPDNASTYEKALAESGRKP